jgi:hypothetical protein
MSERRIDTRDLSVGDVLLFKWPGLAALRAHNETLASPEGEPRLLQRDCVNRLIMGLDDSAYVHAAVVVDVGPPVKIADSLHRAGVVELRERCDEYGASEILVRRLADAAAGDEVAGAARALATGVKLYPYPDLLLSGIDLRVRRLAQHVAGDDALRRLIDVALEGFRPDDSPEGHMCASLVSAAFVDASHRLQQADRVLGEPPLMPECRDRLHQLFMDFLLPQLEGAGSLSPDGKPNDAIDFDALERRRYEETVFSFVVDGTLQGLRSAIEEELRSLEEGHLPRGLLVIAALARRWHAPSPHDPSLWTPGDLEHTTSLETVGLLVPPWC